MNWKEHIYSPILHLHCSSKVKIKAGLIRPLLRQLASLFLLYMTKLYLWVLQTKITLFSTQISEVLSMLKYHLNASIKWHEGWWVDRSWYPFQYAIVLIEMFHLAAVLTLQLKSALPVCAMHFSPHFPLHFVNMIKVSFRDYHNLR